MRRIRTILLGLALSLIVAAPAGATVGLSEFKVEPSSLAAGGHPSVTITQGLTYSSNDDDVKDAFVRLPPGLLGNPQAAALCTQAQFAADTCPEASMVGSVAVNANLVLLPDPLPNVLGLTVNGVVYNVRPTGSEPARIGMVLEAVEGLSKIFLQAPAFLRPGPDGYALETTFADQPRTSAGLNVQIKRIALTFRGAAARGPFMRMPTACGPLTAVGRVNSHDGPASFSQKAFTLTPTGCAALPFAPRAEGAVGAPGMTSAGDLPPVTTTLRFNPEHAALKRAEVTLPLILGPTYGALQRACPRPQANASSCPESSRMGTAIIDSPLQAAPVRGPVYLAFNTSSIFPGLMVMLPPPVGIRLDGVADSTSTGVKNTFPLNPDLPVRSFTIALDSGAEGLFRLSKDLCDKSTDTTMAVSLVAHSGKHADFKQRLATPGCDPRVKMSIRRRGRSARLVARLSAAREGPAITAATLRLPKALRRGTRAPGVFVGRTRLTPTGRGRSLRVRFPGDGTRAAVIRWRGLRAGRGLRRFTRSTIAMTDARGRVTTVKPRVRVRGKRPRARRG